MKGVAFVNHLRLGSASSFRQAGLAKYLNRLGLEGEFLGLRGRATVKAAENMEEWRCFHRISYWDEPLVTKFRANVGIFRKIARDNTVLHVNRANPYSATIAAIGRSGRNKLVVDMEDWDGFGGYSTYASLYNARGALLTLYENTFPRLGDLVLTVSHLLTSRMSQLGVPMKKMLLVPNGYDEELFSPSMSGKEVREEYGLRDFPVVIYMSTFWTFERGLHEVALAAFKQVTRALPDARLLMVGGGNLPVSSLIAEKGLEDRVIPTGFVDRKKIPKLIASADVALHVISDHPFHQASSPMVMPEYMAMGKAIVAPRVGELAYALGDGAGWLVDGVRPDLLAEGVVAVLKDEPKRRAMGLAAEEKARAEYSYRSLASKVMAAYSRLEEG
jgi:glycosyltransferase involved in cell wall biosynthesis